MIQTPQDREEITGYIMANIQEAKELMETLSVEEIITFYKNINDVLLFYRFNKKEIKELLNKPETLEKIPTNRLADLEGLISALRFHLKYVIK